MPPAPTLQLTVTISHPGLGLLLAQVTVVENQVPDKLDDPDLAKVAQAELNMVRRVRRHIENELGPDLAAKLAAEAQRLYGDALDALEFGEDLDPSMQP